MIKYEVYSSWSRDGKNPIAPVQVSKQQFSIKTVSGPKAGRRILGLLRKSGLTNKLPPKKTTIESGPGWFLFTHAGSGYLVVEEGYSVKQPEGILVFRHAQHITILEQTQALGAPIYSNVTKHFAHIQFTVRIWTSKDRNIRGRLINDGNILRVPRHAKGVIDVITDAIANRYPMVPINWAVV